MRTKVAIVGATGTLGQHAVHLLSDSQEFELVAAFGSAGALDVALGADVIVDMTLPAVSQSIVEFAVDHGKRVLVGTSGWSADRVAALSRRIADKPEVGVVIIPNFSIGSVLATSFAALAARYYESIEIVEAHHESKVDSPSGTAVRTAELIGRARAELGPVIATHTDQRARGQQVSSVPIHSLRLQGIVAKQDVIFGGTGETLTISHETIASNAYDAGILMALRAATTVSGVIVGLDTLMDLNSATAQ